MATLKEHQAAMVDLLANGSGIPASASRLAQAMHDVLNLLLVERDAQLQAIIDAQANPTTALKELMNRRDATTPGLNDKALSDCVEACRPKATPAERRVKELENTVKQLKAVNAVFKAQRNDYAKRLADLGALEGTGLSQEQAGCRKEDTQVCAHISRRCNEEGIFCGDCGEEFPSENNT